MIQALAFLGHQEILIIALVVVLLFGASKIPKLMRSMGSGISEFKKGIKEGEKDAVEEGKKEDSKESAESDKK